MSSTTTRLAVVIYSTVFQVAVGELISNHYHGHCPAALAPSCHQRRTLDNHNGYYPTSHPLPSTQHHPHPIFTSSRFITHKSRCLVSVEAWISCFVWEWLEHPVFFGRGVNAGLYQQGVLLAELD
ncbi:hypothetical protein BDN72DRAFT_840449, partial [Pluteus cervinus]